MGIRIAVMLSGGGSNFAAIADACEADCIEGRVVRVISDRADAGGLVLAHERGIEAVHLDPAGYPDRDRYDQALAGSLRDAAVDLVVLAGFMRILSSDFVRSFSGRCLNLHPSLLPAFRGLRPHRQALSAGVQVHGTSVHFVTEELDGGPVIMQAQVPVSADDDEASLEAKVKVQEHALYPTVVAMFAQGRISMGPDGVIMDGERLETPLLMERTA